MVSASSSRSLGRWAGLSQRFGPAQAIPSHRAAAQSMSVSAAATMHPMAARSRDGSTGGRVDDQARNRGFAAQDAVPADRPARKHPPVSSSSRDCRRRPWPETGQPRSAARDAHGRRPSVVSARPRSARSTDCTGRPWRKRGERRWGQGSPGQIARSRSAPIGSRARGIQAREKSAVASAARPGSGQGVRGRREGRGELAYPSEGRPGRAARPAQRSVPRPGTVAAGARGSGPPAAAAPRPHRLRAKSIRITAPSPSSNRQGVITSGIRSAGSGACVCRIGAPPTHPTGEDKLDCGPVPRPQCTRRPDRGSHPARRPVRRSRHGHRTLPVPYPGSPDSQCR